MSCPNCGALKYDEKREACDSCGFIKPHPQELASAVLYLCTKCACTYLDSCSTHGQQYLEKIIP